MSRHDIEELVHRYADAVVHRDREQWAGTWAADATWDLGNERRFEGLDAIVELWQIAMARTVSVIQTCLNGTVELDETAGTGSGRWYIQESVRRADGTNSVLVAHYDDTYVRTGEEWRFASRRLTCHYKGPPDLSGDFPGATDT